MASRAEELIISSKRLAKANHPFTSIHEVSSLQSRMSRAMPHTWSNALHNMKFKNYNPPSAPRSVGPNNLWRLEKTKPPSKDEGFYV